MLEESLRSATFPPTEAAQSLLSFIRYELQDGGSSAEKRFIGLFSLLCERLFGPMGDPSEGFRHAIGGWLSKQARWDLPRAQNSHPHQHTSAPSIYLDPVVQLLCGTTCLKTKEKFPTFMEAMSGKTESRRSVRVQFPLHALPKPTQIAYLSLVQGNKNDVSAIHPSPRQNAYRLLGHLLRVAPKDQWDLNKVIMFKSQKLEHARPLTLSPVPRGSVFSSPKAEHPKEVGGSKSPQILLTMLEYYLIAFLRYPLASPAPTVPAPQGHQRHHLGINRHNTNTAYGEIVYLHLFQCYLFHFLPQLPQSKSFIGFSELDLESEVFLRIIVEFWFYHNMDPIPVAKALEGIIAARKKRGITDTNFDLENVFDIVQVKFDPPPVLIQRCVKTLLLHALSDPNTAPAIMSCQSIAIECKENASLTLPWCLTPIVTVLQQPFYTYVLATFRHAPIHIQGSPFYSALEAWLLWLEPWNLETNQISSKTDIRQTGNVLVNTMNQLKNNSQKQKENVFPSQPIKSNFRRKYTANWEPYLASNLYLYTVPLALFLRRARELDFSSQHFNQSFKLLDRVLRVYSPDLIASIHAIEAKSEDHSMSSLVAAHVANLDVYAPSNIGSFPLTSIQSSVRILLEEIQMQYQKTVMRRGFFDKLEAKIESYFHFLGLADLSQGEDRKIQLLIEKAKLLSNDSSNFETYSFGTMKNENTNQLFSGKSGVHELYQRLDNGTLTDHGREQILSGKSFLKATDISLIVADKLHGSIQTHEMKWLVRLTIEASEYLNSKLSLDGKGRIPMRINLRFLADYRNLILLAMISWLWSRFLSV